MIAPVTLGSFSNRPGNIKQNLFHAIKVRVQVEARQGDGVVRRRRLQGNPARQRRRDAGRVANIQH